MDRPVSFKPILSTGFFDIEASEGGEPYYRLVCSDSVICVLLNPQGEILLVRQFRPNLGYKTLEFLAGGVASGEQPMAAARREIAEESALFCELLPLGKFRLMMNRTTNYEHVFLGLDAKSIPGRMSEAGIEVVAMPRLAFMSAVLSGEFQQIAGLGIVQAASIRLGLDILTAEIDAIREMFHRSQRPQ